ncbi:hypothetical protein OG581_04560 [Streptomyces sp. NBC_01386]|uniref:hypothetical protein n=1 Tax=Streptomyces sp. NBC_01386 TaxID=2903848 RepID=UPI00324DC465
MVVPDLSQDPGGELDAGPGETQQHFGVRLLMRERLFHRLGEVVGGGAGGSQVDQEGEHVLAESDLDRVAAATGE